MPGAIVDPDELKRFSAELLRFNTDLNQNLTRLKGRFRHLGETWKDQEFRKYSREFEQTERVLRQFLASSEKQLPILREKERWIRKYLGQ